MSRDEVDSALHERRSVSHEGGVGAGKLRNDPTLSQRRRLWMLRLWWARRVDVLHGAAEQAVKLPVRCNSVQQTALPVAIAVWDSRMLLGVDDVLSWDVDGAGLPPVRPASPLLLLPRMLLLLIEVGLLCLGDLAHQSW